MCAALAVLGVIWCILALVFNGLWASILIVGGLLALVVIGAMQEGLRERRGSAWIASEIEDRIGHSLAPTQRGVSLREQTFTGGLRTLARAAEEVAYAVNRLGRSLAGTTSPQRTQALLSNLKVVIAPALAELANLQALRVRPEDEEGHRLLVATFTGVLRQIGDWASLGKDRVRVACADLSEGRSAKVELPLTLVPPPELHSLHTWLQARGWWNETPPTPLPPGGTSLSTGLLAGLVVGSMLGGHGHSDGSS